MIGIILSITITLLLQLYSFLCLSYHTNRVVPLHSFKFAAELQYQLGGESYQTNPLVVRIDRKAGHGAGKPMDKVIEEAADTYAFISHFVGASYHV